MRTLRDVFERYRLEVLPRKAPKTQRNQFYMFPVLEAVYGDMAPAAIRPKHVYQYLSRRGRKSTYRLESVTDDGLLIKTAKTGKELLIDWTDELRAVITRAQRLDPRVRAPLLCTLGGRAYTGDGFSAMWQRVMAKAVEAGIVRFTFHDLRAKSASDDELAAASERLGHTSQAITKRVYVRKPIRVKPLR